MVSWMWLDKAGPPMNAIHMGYPIGSSLAPLIAMNFLKPQTDSENSTTTMGTSTLAYESYNSIIGHNGKSYSNSNESIYHKPNNNLMEPELNAYYNQYTTMVSADEPLSRIEIPYGIAGGIALMIALLFAMLFTIDKCKHIHIYGQSKSSIKETFSPKGFKSIGSTRFTVAIMILVCILLGLCNSASAAINPYTFSFATESHLQFTNDQASMLEITYHSVAIVSRMTCTIISRWVPSHVILGVASSLYAISAVCLAIFAPNDKVYLWLFMCTFQFSLFPIVPAGMLWSATYIRYSSLIVGFVSICYGIMFFFSSWASGYLYDLYPGGEYMFFGMFLVILMWLVWLSMQILASCYVKLGRLKDRPDMSKVWTVDPHHYVSSDNYVALCTESTYL